MIQNGEIGRKGGGVTENYQLWLDRELSEIARSGRTPRLLLHSCCGPCSSYVLDYLARYFDITVDYYNPNLYPAEEFDLRFREQERLLREMPLARPVGLRRGAYEPQVFEAAVKGLEDEPEGGARCDVCYRLRLTHAARLAQTEGFDFFTTTLSVSPYKHADRLNAIGGELAKEVGVAYLYSDFKKRDGYKRSCELAARYGLYRQDYCGCAYSLRARGST